jgi:hypothetical protein
MTVSILKLPTSATPFYSYQVLLEGVEFTLSFRYLSRGDSGWHLSISDNQDAMIASNIKLVPWFDLLSALTITGLPTGKLGIACISQPFPKAPVVTLDNLSTDFQLLYYSAT